MSIGLTCCVTIGAIWKNGIQSSQQVEWEYVPDLRIGAIDGGPEAFSRVLAIETDDHGRVFVLDSDNRHIVVFSANGRVVRTIGKRGRGPGELEQPTGLAWVAPGRLLIVDPGNSRYTVYDTTGQLISDTRRPIALTQIPWGGSTHNSTICDYSITRRGEREWDTFTSIVNGRVTATLQLPRLTRMRLETSPGSFVAVPFAPTQAHLIDCVRGGVWRASSAEPHLHFISFSGDTIRRLAHGFPRTAISGRERDDAVANLVRAMSRSRAGQSSIDRRDLANAIPAYKPYYSALFLGPRSEVWIRHPNQDPQREPVPRYRIYDERGRITDVRFPSWVILARPIVRDSVAYVVNTDGDGVYYVQRLKRRRAR